ncbi:MAG: N-acetylmuramoyl-L-alanine amidase [Thermoanaerobaculia bacterium]
MRKGWVIAFAVLLHAAVLHAAAVKPRVVAISDGISASLDKDQEISLLVKPKRGDAWTRLALRATGDADLWKTLAKLNRMGESLPRDRSVRVPFSMIKPSLQAKVLVTLFPDDVAAGNGWKHKVVAGGPLEGESLWRIAEWFTGDGANYAAIRKANAPRALSTRRGEWIVIPDRLLSPALRAAMPRPVKAAETEIAEDDPEAPAEVTTTATVMEAVAPVEPFTLEYDRSAEQPYAIYRIRKGEALYSSVGIRFTGRVYAKDVNEVVDQIVEFNGIADVSRIPVGYPVKIPMELLIPDYRPTDDPRRVEQETKKRESARLARRVEAKDLRGIRIIVDAGHGGRDVGTTHEGAWESVYVYDIAARLKKLVEAKSAGKVSMTTKSESSGYSVPDRDKLRNLTDHAVLTTPRYDLTDPVVGVNLRWYLANSILGESRRKSVPEENVVFLSIHADSLHPSLRGAMAYIPGERYVRGSFTKKGKVYLARAEVRESPTVSHSSEDALRAEGLSRRLAETIIGSFRRNDLKVHPFNPVRDNVVRNGREWVPAVIRYNKVPTRLLLEVCNLGNAEDRRLMKTKEYRQEVAEAIYEGLVRFYSHGSRDDGLETMVKAAAR